MCFYSYIDLFFDLFEGCFAILKNISLNIYDGEKDYDRKKVGIPQEKITAICM